jgi:hypothetical protein
MRPPEIRLYAPGDEVAINAAFNRVFGKDRSLEEWSWKYGSGSPPLPIVAAWEGHALVAHNGGIAVNFQVDGRRIRALQGADTLSLAAAERRPEWRGAWQEVMDRFAETAAADFGVSLLYGFTGGRAVSHMVHRARWDSVAPRRIPLYVRRQRPAGRSLASRFFKARLIDDDEPALDRLWDKAGRRYPVAVVRGAEHARRRLSGHPSVRYHRWLITTRLSSSPAAFVAFRTDGGVCRWVDLVWDGRPGALELVDHLSRGLAEQTGAGSEELWLDGDEEAASWLEVFGFEGGPDPSGVARVTRFLDESLDAESFAPERYYTTMADADLV